MSLDGGALLTGVSKYMADWWASSTTATSSPTTTQIIDSALAKLGGDDYIRDWFIRITGTGTYQWDVRRVVAFTAATGVAEVFPAFTAAIGSGVTYELHRYDPTGKFTALDEARLAAYPEIAIIAYDETLTGDGETDVFAIPTAIRVGPAYVREEIPEGVNKQWNFLGAPVGDDTTKWTGSNATLASYARTSADPLVPKYDPTCTSIVVAASTAATVTQVVANMQNGITAVLAAGRHMTFAMWVFSRLASKMRLQILTAAGTLASGSYHGGKGWELLTVEGDVAGNNTTTLSVRIDIASTADSLTAFWNRGWFYFGTPEKVNNPYGAASPRQVRRDDTTKKVYLGFTPTQGRQLQLVGLSTVTALGTTATTQVTNTMEVDEQSAQLLYAHAAKIIFEREGITAADGGEVTARVNAMLARKRDMAPKFPFPLPTTPPMKGPWLA